MINQAPACICNVHALHFGLLSGGLRGAALPLVPSAGSYRLRSAHSAAIRNSSMFKRHEIPSCLKVKEWWKYNESMKQKESNPSAEPMAIKLWEKQQHSFSIEESYSLLKNFHFLAEIVAHSHHQEVKLLPRATCSSEHLRHRKTKNSCELLVLWRILYIYIDYIPGVDTPRRHPAHGLT